MTDENFHKIYQSQSLATLKGAYFRFQRRTSASTDESMYGSKVCLKDERSRIQHFEANPTEPFLIMLHPTFGRPGSLAYRIWTHLERGLSKNTQTIDVSVSKLLSILNLSKNQRRIIELNNALNQLEHTKIFYHSSPFLGAKPADNVRSSFGLINTNIHCGGTWRSYEITIDPLVVDMMRGKRRYFSFNWQRIADLHPASQCFALLVLDGMTRRQIKYTRSNETGEFYYQKSYAMICDEWLAGSIPYPTPGVARKQHLNSRFKDLIECGILSDKTELTNSMVVKFYPGPGFLMDYQQLYPTITPTEKIEAEQLIKFFGTHYYGDEARTIHASDYSAAKNFINDYGSLAEAKTFIAFAIRAARLTKWNNIKFLNALGRYQKEYAQSRSSETPDKPAITEQHRDAYEKETNQMILDSYHALPPHNKSTIDAAIALESPDPSSIDIKVIQYMHIYRFTSVPTIEQWLKVASNAKKGNGVSV